MTAAGFTYDEAVAYIEELPKFTKKHTLDHVRQFLRRLGNPASDRKIVHVAGTNGKGSVCAYIQAILMAEGKRAGFFTSPHLVSINERIRIDNIQIDNEAFLEAFGQAQGTARQMEEEGLGHPSYFEFLLGMGMTAFAGTDVEYIILETGIGGRLDATNYIERPTLAVITSISLDHTDILGDTIEEIAAEKAGIIKPGIPVFFDASNPLACKVIQKTAAKMHAPCREISKNAYEIREVNWKYIAFSRTNAYDKDVIYRAPICGCYQVMNAQIALEAAEYLLKDETIHKSRWVDAIGSMRWEGRMERVAPHLVIDGAHNLGALEAFAESVKALGADEGEGPVVVFSAVSDKKYEQMIEYLCRNMNASAYIVTEIEDKRRVAAEELERLFKKYTRKKVYRAGSLKEALEKAENERKEEEDIFCLGSLYLVGMVKKLLAGGGYHA